MKSLQEVFDRIQETKTQQRNIKIMYADALANSHEYQDVVEKMKKLKTIKKEIEDQTKAELGTEWEKLDLMKLHLREDKETLTDIAISTLMKGETVKVTDKSNNDYEPIFSVRFSKANEVRQENS